MPQQQEARVSKAGFECVVSDVCNQWRLRHYSAHAAAQLAAALQKTASEAVNIAGRSAVTGDRLRAARR